MRYKTIDPEFFSRNRKRLTEKLASHSIDIVHANDEMFAMAPEHIRKVVDDVEAYPAEFRFILPLRN